MKKAYLILFCCILFLMLLPASICHAQQEESGFHSWQVQVGGAYASPAFMSPTPLASVSAEVLYTPERHKWFSIGLTMSIPCVPAPTDGYASERFKHRMEDLAANGSYMLSFRGNWINRTGFSLYSEIAGGLGVMIFPAYQLVPIGVTFGKRFYGFAEAGYGFQYQGGRAGIGWKF